MTESTSILIMSTLGVGDVLLAQPLFHEIRKASPYNHLYILARSGPPASLARRLGVADEVFDYMSGTQHRIRHALEIGRWIRSKRFNATIATTGMNPLYTAVMASVSGARVRIGERRGHFHWVWTTAVPVAERTHVVIRNRNIGRALGVEPGLIPRLILEDQDHERARALLPETDRCVAIIPGSNKELAHKRWPISHYRDLVRALMDHAIHPIVLGGPDEESLGAEITDGFPSDKISDVVGKTDLGTAAAILSFCSLAVGNDCMLLHFAAAVGTRTIALFGPSDPEVYRPMGSNNIVIKTPLSCAPCYNIDTRGCINPRCMTILSPHIVINRTISMVGGSGGRP